MPGLIFDYHTHTTYSHGKGSIEDNVQEGIRKGLSEIAIADHGPGHIAYGMKRSSIRVMREEIDQLQKKYQEIKIYLSVEANIMNLSGKIDVSEEEWKIYDFVLAGYHYGAFGERPFQDLIVHGKNYVLSALGTSTRKLKIANTERMIRSIYENKLKLITHPGDKYDIFIDEVAKACNETGTWMEINNSHPHLTKETIIECAKEDVTFVIGSDAHVSEKVGNYQNALARIEDAGLDKKRVINLK